MAATLSQFVNNAGIVWMGPTLDMPLEALQAMLRVNVEGVTNSLSADSPTCARSLRLLFDRPEGEAL